MAKSQYRGHEDVDVRVQEGREAYQEVHGESPPVNPGEAANGFVRVGESVYDQPWRDYEGVKSVDAGDVKYNDLVNESGSSHTYDRDNDWQNYDPETDFLAEADMGKAMDVFERMTGETEQLLEPRMVTDGGKDVSYESEQTMKDVDHNHSDYDAPL